MAKCPICDNNAEINALTTTYRIECSLCGIFNFGSPLQKPRLTESEKLKLRYYYATLAEDDEERVKDWIRTDNKNEFLSKIDDPPSSLLGKIDLVLKYINEENKRFGQEVHIIFRKYPLFFCIDPEELLNILKYLNEEKLIFIEDKYLQNVESELKKYHTAKALYPDLMGSIQYTDSLCVYLKLLYAGIKRIEEYRRERIKDKKIVEKENLNTIPSVDYDVALSFAGENRVYVGKVAEYLKNNDIKVFYDEFEQIDLWGKDLGQHLHTIYSRDSKYCIPFISKEYKEKIWTRHEFKSALERALQEKKEYILPARFDNTEIEGLMSTIGYMDLTQYSPEDFGQMIIKKIKQD